MMVSEMLILLDSSGAAVSQKALAASITKRFKMTRSQK
jgi:hypothetical protein